MPFPCRAQTGKLPRTDQLSWEECFPLCVYAHVVSVLCVLLFHFFPSPPHPLILPPSSLSSGATGCYLELSLTCAVTLAAAGGRIETHITQRSENHRSLHGFCILSSSSSSSSSSLPLHLSPLYPTHSALCALSSGEVAWSYIIHGSCDLRRVSYGRSNKMECRWGYDEHKTGERDTSLCLPLLCTALFVSYTHVGVQNGFDLFWNGWSRMGQHNRCFETKTKTKKQALLQWVIYFRFAGDSVVDRYSFHLIILWLCKEASSSFLHLGTARSQAAIFAFLQSATLRNNITLDHYSPQQTTAETILLVQVCIWKEGKRN